ncbi:hypothetical protein GFV14_00354 [Candidatus Hartigia pinicola]|nr:hypothetical protein GFV14_00354 [Candidatus Hartigia pinicola]
MFNNCRLNFFKFCYYTVVIDFLKDEDKFYNIVLHFFYVNFMTFRTYIFVYIDVMSLLCC